MCLAGPETEVAVLDGSHTGLGRGNGLTQLNYAETHGSYHVFLLENKRKKGEHLQLTLGLPLEEENLLGNGNSTSSSSKGFTMLPLILSKVKLEINLLSRQRCSSAVSCHSIHESL